MHYHKAGNRQSSAVDLAAFAESLKPMTECPKVHRCPAPIRPPDKGATFFVGLGNRSHDAMSPNSLAKMLAIRGKKGGVTGPANPHSFTHAFARDYLMSGGDAGSLAGLLGHTNVLVTQQYYGVFTTDQLREKHARHSPVARMSAHTSGLCSLPGSSRGSPAIGPTVPSAVDAEP